MYILAKCIVLIFTSILSHLLSSWLDIPVERCFLIILLMYAIDNSMHINSRGDK